MRDLDKKTINQKCLFKKKNLHYRYGGVHDARLYLPTMYVYIVYEFNSKYYIIAMIRLMFVYLTKTSDITHRPDGTRIRVS